MDKILAIALLAVSVILLAAHFYDIKKTHKQNG